MADRKGSQNSPDTATSNLARERLYAETLKKLEARIADNATEVRSLRSEVRRLENERLLDSKAIRGHEVRLNRLRIDRQITGFPRWLALRLQGRREEASKTTWASMTSKGRLLVVAPKYPSSVLPYGGQPVERRVRLYAHAGYDVTVFIPAAKPSPVEIQAGGVRIIRDEAESIGRMADGLAIPQICVHHPLPELWESVKSLAERYPMHVWIHGYEARDWRDLSFNYSAREVREQGPWLDAVMVDRQIALRELFADERITKIFVSDMIRTTAEVFAGVPSVNSKVIHNVVDTEIFPYKAKTPDQRRNILVVRSFAGRNYGTDLLVQTIHRLSTEPWFDDLTIDIRGDGVHFDEDAEGLTSFKNVSIERGILDGQELAELHRRNGVMLIPTRWDSQGMTMGEAMSSGLVPVTNAVTAISEFADEETAMLVGPEDVEGLANSIGRLYRDPGLFLAMSAAASKRARRQCGPEATVHREMALFEAAKTVSSFEVG